MQNTWDKPWMSINPILSSQALVWPHITDEKLMWWSGSQTFPKVRYWVFWPPVSSAVRKQQHPLEAGPHERKLSHWGNAFEQSIGTQPLLSLFHPHHPATISIFAPTKYSPLWSPELTTNLNKMASFCFSEEKSNRGIFTQLQLPHGQCTEDHKPHIHLHVLWCPPLPQRPKANTDESHDPTRIFPPVPQLINLFSLWQ